MSKHKSNGGQQARMDFRAGQEPKSPAMRRQWNTTRASARKNVTRSIRRHLRDIDTEMDRIGLLGDVLTECQKQLAKIVESREE